MKYVLTSLCLLALTTTSYACGGASSFRVESTRMVPVSPLDQLGSRWSQGLRITERSDGSLVANSGSNRVQIRNRRLLTARGNLFRGEVRRAERPVMVRTRRSITARACAT